jgi:hypothetical protein
MSIEGLRPTQPVGVVLAAGIKDPNKGFPTQTDRYWLVNVKEEKGVRALHPSFARFNSLATNRDLPPEKLAAELDARRVIRGNLVHSTEAECWNNQLRAQVLPLDGGKPVMHPDKRPVCSGNGITAQRYMPDGTFKTIECPNEACPYRVKPEKGPTLCKPDGHLLFQLRWPEGNPLPAMLCRYDTGAWRTNANIQGFFDYIANTAREMGMEKYTLFGYPFMLQITRQTKASSQQANSVTVITPEIEPVAFFRRQRETLREIGQEVPRVMITSREVIDVIDHDAAVGRGLSVPRGE